jgi:hypothetical protein
VCIERRYGMEQDGTAFGYEYGSPWVLGIPFDLP